MEIYRKNDSLLFNAITDALEAIEAQNIGTAREILIRAQQEAEERLLASGDDKADG